MPVNSRHKLVYSLFFHCGDFSEMKIIAKIYCILMLQLLCVLFYSGKRIHAFSYDYSATTECLAEPWRPHYGGGLIVNPEFDDGIEGWTVFGQGAIREGTSHNGNRYIIAHSRTQSLDSFSQKVQLEKGKFYSFSGWVQMSEGSETVFVVFKTSDGKMIHGGKVIAKHGCWSLLKGGLLPNFTSVVEIFLKSKNTKVEIWADNISLQSFTKRQWRSHQEKSIDKVRKHKVKFQLNYANKTSLDAAIVSIKQTDSNIPFGCGMNQKILSSTDYQNWFVSRFKFTTFTNAMKWYSTEEKQGQENYTIADAMVKFSKQNGISIRGHNILWDDPKYQPEWVKTLAPKELRKAAEKRIKSVVSRYSGQLITWDVVNENLHFRFFEDKLGENASAEFYNKAYQLDPKTAMFMNEYNTTECAIDEAPNAINYKKKLEEIRSFPGNADMLLGIGVQGRFGGDKPPDLAYMRSSLDILASTRLPIWYTEVSVGNGTNQAQYLEEVLREAYSHPAVEGIITFAGPESAGFKEMPLVDNDFKNTPAGDVVDKLLAEWKSKNLQLETTSGSGGSFEVSLPHGDYNVTVKHPGSNSTTSINFKVTKHLPLGIVNVEVAG